MTLSHASPVETSSAYGLFPAEAFVVTTGRRAAQACRAKQLDFATFAGVPQALWFFSSETIALPRPGHRVAGFDPLKLAVDDLLAWNSVTPPGAARDYPGLVWIGAPDALSHVRLDAEGERLLTPDGSFTFAPAPRLASNRSFYNAASTAFFSQRTLHMRGEWASDAKRSCRRFIAHTIWPEDFRLDPLAPLKPVPASPAALRDFVRSEPNGGARSAFATQVVWKRDPTTAEQRAGRPLIGLMLNGSQGDDDEAHGGHFGLMTGHVGPNGEMHDWLVANFYTLATESEKGIIAAMRPLDGYLADVNSGQSWYRPSYLLVATLRNERTAAHLASALGRVFNQFYRQPTSYRHASANCTGISVSTLRAIGWNVPKLGATSWLKAIVSLPAVAFSTGSLRRGKTTFDYFTEDQTRLLPALAFEQAGADLLQLVTGETSRALTSYEKLLQQDVEEILLVRIPQLPSSRAWGDYPVVGVDEYHRRLPKDPAQQQIIPVDPRPFPPELMDPVAPKLKPLRSDYALATYALALLVLGAWAGRTLVRRWQRNTRGKGGSDE